MKTKSQKYSTFVFETVQNLISAQGDAESMPLKRYKSLCKRAGGILRTVGLIHFLSFMAAKATKESEIHYAYLLEHLRRELSDINIVNSADNGELLQVIRNQELPEYMRTTSETLKLLQWHKRVSEILIAGSAEEE